MLGLSASLIYQE